MRRDAGRPTDLGELLAGPPPSLGLDATGLPTRALLVVAVDDYLALPAHARTRARTALAGTRCCRVGVTGGGAVPDELAEVLDLVLTDRPDDRTCTVTVDDVDAAVTVLASRLALTPRAALGYVWLLRQSTGLPVPEALAAESALYSTLLAGPEFARWLAARGPARPPDDRSVRVVAERDGDHLRVRLTRPARRNAVDAAMRDALLTALAPAEWDPRLVVEITGAGPTFCAGGDLDEFGSAADPASGHVVRLEASVAAVLHRLRDRVTVRLHGTCLGAGFELPCFAGTVLAAPDTQLGLPELAMGLVPGAGGTVGVVRRAGRWRAAWLGLSGTRVDARTALSWGLVDGAAA